MFKPKDILTSNEVAISVGNDGYPTIPPYSPSKHYPEYPFGGETCTAEPNPAYEGVRSSLRLLKLDEAHFGQKAWNPLGLIISPGDTVVLKPNFVRHFRDTYEGHDDCLITHGSIIRAVLDYAYIALKGEGRIIVADAPHSDTDFDAIRRMAGLADIQTFYGQHTGFDIEVFDLRPEMTHKVDGVICGHERLPGDPNGYVKVDLGKRSAFCEVEKCCHLLYGSEYDTSEICRHHSGGIHEYLISKTILDADCVINLPKLKTHKKTGITVCMKNLVGINGNKNWLPHYRLGTPAKGGDQFADGTIKHSLEQSSMAGFRRVFPLLGPIRKHLAKPLKAVGTKFFGDTTKDTIRSGNWYGNDTTWRMTLDLNRILMYADGNGHVHPKPIRRLFCVVDGIVGGEGNGPMDATPKLSRSIIAGMTPAAVELVCARLMGFDFQKLPVLYRSLDNNHPLPLLNFSYDDISCVSNHERLNKYLKEIEGEIFAFEPHFGWKGHIELDSLKMEDSDICLTTNDTNGHE